MEIVRLCSLLVKGVVQIEEGRKGIKEKGWRDESGYACWRCGRWGGDHVLLFDIRVIGPTRSSARAGLEGGEGG